MLEGSLPKLLVHQQRHWDLQLLRIYHKRGKQGNRTPGLPGPIVLAFFFEFQFNFREMRPTTLCVRIYNYRQHWSL